MPEQLKQIQDLDSGPDGQAIEYNLMADAYDVPAPPPAGNYACKAYIGRDGIQLGYVDGNPDSPYYVIPLELRIEGGEWDGRIIYARIDTRVWPGRDTSTLATFLAKRVPADKLPRVATPKQWAKLAVGFLKREPIVYCAIDWQAYSTGDGAVVLEGMHNFPKGSNGKYSHIVTDKKGIRCYARARLVRWLSKEEYEVKTVPTVSELSVIDDTLGIPL